MRVADSAVSGGLSSCSRSVRKVLIRKSDMLMLRIVSTLRRLLRKAFRKMNGRNRMEPVNLTHDQRNGKGAEHKKVRGNSGTGSIGPRPEFLTPEGSHGAF